MLEDAAIYSLHRSLSHLKSMKGTLFLFSLILCFEYSSTCPIEWDARESSSWQHGLQIMWPKIIFFLLICNIWVDIGLIVRYIESMCVLWLPGAESHLSTCIPSFWSVIPDRGQYQRGSLMPQIVCLFHCGFSINNDEFLSQHWVFLARGAPCPSHHVCHMQIQYMTGKNNVFTSITDVT